MKKTLKLVALLIALVMVFAVVLSACEKDCGDGNHKDANHDGVCDVCKKEGLTVTHTGGTATCADRAKCDVCGKEYGELLAHDYDPANEHCKNCGAWLVPDTNNTNVWIGAAGDYMDKKVYTINDYTAGMQSLNWNPHTWEESLDSTVLGMITVGFYDFVLNKAGDGYTIVPELATYVPGTSTAGVKFSGDLFQNVTAQYVGTYGVKAGETNKAFRIYLNPNATWDDAAHTKITAQSYIYSMQQQLNPLMSNRRADSYYGGDFSIVGAKSYLNQGSFSFNTLLVPNGNDYSTYIKNDTFTRNSAGVLLYQGKEVAINIGSQLKNDMTGTNNLALFYNAGMIPPVTNVDEQGRPQYVNKKGEVVILRSADSELVLDNEGRAQYVDQFGNLVLLRSADPTNSDPEAPEFSWWAPDGTVLTLQKVYNRDGKFLFNQFVDAEGNIVIEDDSTLSLVETFTWFDKDGNEVERKVVDGETVFAKANGDIVVKASEITLSLTDHFANLASAADANGNVKLTDALLAELNECLAALFGYDSFEELRADCEADEDFVDCGENWADVAWQNIAGAGDIGAAVDWSTVGLIAGRDEASGLEYLDIIIEDELRTPEFYVPYYNSSTWLVLESLYEANKVYRYTDGSSTIGTQDSSKTLSSITSQYCTSIATSAGYGPYSLTGFQLDKEIKFSRNESWYGYSDGLHYGQYQMDNYVITIIESHASALLAFENGEIDSIGLQSADLEKYGSSSKLQTTPDTYTTKISFVTDYAALRARERNGVNKTIITVQDFREAFSLSLNRRQFVQSLTAGADAGFGLLNYMYVHDVNGGKAYRDTDAGKKAIVDLYGLEYGAGKTYPTLDDAYMAVTGYDPTKAKALWDSAVTYALTHNIDGETVAAGANDALYIAGDIVEIQMDVYSTDEIYVKMVNFLQEAVTATTKGTALENKIRIKLVANADYYDTIAVGGTDLIFSTWGGAQFNGLGMIARCYTDDPTGRGNQMEYGFDCSKIELEITVDLEGNMVYRTFKSDLKNWADWLNSSKDAKPILDSEGQPLSVAVSYDLDVLQEIFGEVEREYLSHFVAIPIYYRNSVSIDSNKYNSAVDTYVNLVGYGGIRFMTFNYDDATWAVVGGNQDYTK